MAQPKTHSHDDGPHTHDIGPMRSGESFGRGVKPEITDDADETMPLIPPMGVGGAEDDCLDRSREQPLRPSGLASVS